jgi:hypothetical protein
MLRSRTHDYLEKAERNRAVALTLLAPATARSLSPPPFEWAVVVLF